jgi:mannose/fructose/N-acetylgalactosamine-specific phosphotransferase system component IID
LPAVELSAQNNDNDNSPFNDAPQRSRWVEDENEEMVDGMPYFNIRRYMDELVALIILVIIVALVNHFAAKRNRLGCTFFTILFFVILYFIRRYV